MQKPRPGKTGPKIKMPPPWGPLAEALGGTKKLAEALGVESDAVNLWAKKKRRPGLLTIEKIEALCKTNEVEIPEEWLKKR
ncbi:MAG: hypothetical protein EOP04_09430 [Proteobacteria bacterium]|nr:MAG: hypothetical protein EOP04_09430 [Pseudomonadota bacterium]